MKFLRAIKELFTGKKAEPTPEYPRIISTNTYEVAPLPRLNESRADPFFVKQLLPRSAFTKTLTKHRRKLLRRSLLRLNAAQLATAKRMGWDRGVL